ncbi:NACHT domain-containing protein [Kitasatospora sp. P5_F3]
MTIADLVTAPDVRREPFGALVHVEYQLRVLGLLCAAADQRPAKFATPGSLEKWAEYSVAQSERLGCAECRTDALAVAASIDIEVVAEPGMSIQKVRNQVCHGGPMPDAVDREVLYRVVADNAERIVRIYEHGHVTELAPYFGTADGTLAALHSFSGTSARYWPRRGEAFELTDRDIVDALRRLELQRGDRLLDDYARDIARDLAGFAEPDSVCTLVSPPEPVVVRWERRTTVGSVERFDRFEVGADHARTWLSESGPKPYKAFLADICNWPLLKERLLEKLEDQVSAEKRVSLELFGKLHEQVRDVPTLVRIDDEYQGTESDLTIAEACTRVADGVHAYRGSTSLITLTGEAGSGKTHSLLQFARESLTAGGELAPVVIYVSSSRSGATTLEKLINDSVTGTMILVLESVLALCRAGLAVLVIDGFDEMLGFRTYDNPLSGLEGILRKLRDRGAVILSARSSYSEARLRTSLAKHPAKDGQHRLTMMELVPWRAQQLRELTADLPIDVASPETAPETRQMLTTPFFCLAFAAWMLSDRTTGFLQFVVDSYLQRELGKLEGKHGGPIFDQQMLAAIFCEAAEMSQRKESSEVSEDELKLAAELALGRALEPEEERRLVALCGMSAEWSDEELSFSFTHLAIAEHFLARQVVRVPSGQALSLLTNVAISALCAQLIASMWPPEPETSLAALVTELQERVTAAGSPDDCGPAMASLGELWARVHGTDDVARSASRIIVDRLELGGSGVVTLDQAEVQTLVVGSDVRLRLTASRIHRLDISQSSGNPLVGDSHEHVSELLTQSGLVTSPRQIRELLGLPEEVADEGFIEKFFREKIANSRVAIVVDRHYNAPDEDVRMRWTREFGAEKWTAFAKRLVAEGELIEERVNAAGSQKRRLRLTDAFHQH